MKETRTDFQVSILDFLKLKQNDKVRIICVYVHVQYMCVMNTINYNPSTYFYFFYQT